ncbi:MAG TPA: glycerol-3-phosphate dehydrogenase, partial [Gemmatimonadaceae bacterium]|nr:glycerol-3-phosphate dehydrogenase [Gemmatimonadaceae bacterium]
MNEPAASAPPLDSERPAATAPRERAARLARLGTEQFDLLIIGGGINGAGVARDAAMRGLRTALVERNDFASGTSSRSSRLVHGGVRYLEHGHLRLVFESSRERRTLLRLAPHLVRPLRFTWPVYRGARLPRWKLLAGLFMYDALAVFRNVASHEALDAREVAAREPALLREGLVGGAQYYDAATDDARLTLANVIAAHEREAVVLNHVTAVRFLREGERIVGAVVRPADEEREIAVRATVVVNAAGPWSDEVRALDAPASRSSVRATKGVHVAVSRERLATNGAITLLSPIDGRVMFVLPSTSTTIIGTTDTPTDERPGEVRASAEDIEYLLDSVNAFFPAAKLGTGDVIASWAGIRPLIAAGYSDRPASASREHRIDRAPSGLVSVTGGKLTTYRAMAAEVANVVERALGRRPRRARTDQEPLPGGDLRTLDEARRAAELEVGDAVVAKRLVEAHGSRWREVAALTTAEPALARRIVRELPYLLAEVVYAVEREMALTLGDLLVRRLHIAYETADHGRAAARVATAVLAGRLGWDNARAR